MPTLTVSVLINRLSAVLAERFPNDEFSIEELQCIVRALISSVRWTALSEAKDAMKDGKLVEEIRTIRTNDHFASSSVSRNDILDRISYTSGLDRSISQ